MYPSAAANVSRRSPVTPQTLQTLREQGQPIVALTAYDYVTARVAEEAGVDCLLVGDSLGMVVLGYDSTLPVTMEEMLHHTRAVARGANRALVVGDMPFMSYQAEVAEAVRNAGRFLKEAGARAVKLEGGHPSQVACIRAIAQAGIPVMAHLGFTPQAVHAIGMRVQARTEGAIAQLLEQALAVEAAGAFAVVLELIPAEVAQMISTRLTVPTIGIGAGAATSGQIQVVHDILGLYPDWLPRHAKRYINQYAATLDALRTYCDEVRQRQFPEHAHSAHLPVTSKVPGDAD